jgi:catechol 2,3-dioxygenase-like lactoylglutathione lyase family enzyme
MIRFKRLDHIQICIPKSKEEDARNFYSGIIGLKEISKPAALLSNGGLWFEIADIQLHVGTEDEINRSKRHPAFEVFDLESAKTFLISKGILIKEETEIPGQQRFSFKDPFGNRIEFLEKNKNFRPPIYLFRKA